MWHVCGTTSRRRTVSLGICAVLAPVRPDLDRMSLASDRERHQLTEANGPIGASVLDDDLPHFRQSRCQVGSHNAGRCEPMQGATDRQRPPLLLSPLLSFVPRS